MQTYLVGGAVRDALMGRPVQDRDWVVVGATPQQLLDQGYLPVGRDFPVFLHPQSKEEYALARTERNTAPGYRGFAVHAAPDVTLEEDLARRDLTMNAIAVPASMALANGTQSGEARHPAQSTSPAAQWEAAGALVDPFGGRQDIANKVLRHVSPAFSEDPVRILRLARFAARYADFRVAPETLALMRAMVAQGDTDHLVAERVWQEIARGLMEAHPSRMFAVLRDCGALQRLLPELDRLWSPLEDTPLQTQSGLNNGAHAMQVVELAAGTNAPLTVRLACLLLHVDQPSTPMDIQAEPAGAAEHSTRLLKEICQRLRIPVECKELAEVVAREHGNIHRSAPLDASGIVHLLERCDAFRKPARFDEILQACACDARARPGMQDAPYPQATRLANALKHAQAVATDRVAMEAQKAGATGQAIGEWIRRYRTEAVTQTL